MLMGARWWGPQESQVAVLLAPGDAGRMADPVLSFLLKGLVEAGFWVGSFDADGGEDTDESPDEACTRLIREVRLGAGERQLILGGISRGARVSLTLVEELGAVGFLAFSYPFHARTDPHTYGRELALSRCSVPVLLCQGTRDSHGNRQQILGYGLPSSIHVHWMEDANHALKPKVSSGRSQATLIGEAVEETLRFIRSLEIP